MSKPRRPRSEQYVVVVISAAAESQAFGPFRSYHKAEEIFDRINDADGGQDEVNARLLSLDRPTEAIIKGWIKDLDEEDRG